MIRQRAELVDRSTVKLADGSRVTARTILIATGARPFVPDALKGFEHVITSNEAFELEQLPRRIVIVGGGYIAVEFAGIFAGLGCETILLYRGDQILRGFDDDIRHGLAAEMAKKGVEIRLRSEVVEVERSGDGVRLTLSDQTRFGANVVMYATGRTPNTANLGLAEAGVELTPQAAVKVDDYSQSTMPGIYAVGDVTNRINLTPVAVREGQAFADTVFGGRPTAVDYTNVPSAVFSQPEIGTVGLTERDGARQAQAHRRLQAVVPPHEAYAVGARRAHAHEARRRRRQRTGARDATSWVRERARWRSSSPSPSSSGPPRPISTRRWRFTRRRPKSW